MIAVMCVLRSEPRVVFPLPIRHLKCTRYIGWAFLGKAGEYFGGRVPHRSKRLISGTQTRVKELICLQVTEQDRHTAYISLKDGV